MASNSHFLSFVLVFAASGFTYATGTPMLSCERAQKPPDWSNVNVCTSSDGTKAFDPCPIKTRVIPIHEQIQQNLEEECEVEQRAQGILNERERLQAQGHRGLLPKVSQRDHDILRRIYGSGRKMDGPARGDSCLANRLLNRLMIETENKCRSRSNLLLKVCKESGHDAEEAKKVAQNRTEEAMKHRSKSGALAFAYKQQRLIGEQLISLQNANKLCSEKFSELRTCTQIYNEVFKDQEVKNLADHCTHEGLIKNVESYVDFMQSALGPARVMRASSKSHEENRKKESYVAQQLERLTRYIAELEKALNPGEVRAYAGESGQGELQVNLAQSRRCDSVYRPSHCLDQGDENLDLKDDLAREVGINLERSTDPLVAFSARTITIGSSKMVESPNPGRPRLIGDGAGTSPSQSQASSTEPGATSAEQSVEGETSSYPDAAFSGGVQAASIKASAVDIRHPGGGMKTVGGLVYSDEPELETINAPETTSQAPIAQSFTPPSAVVANKAFDTGSNLPKKKSSQENSGAGAAPTGGIHQFGEIDNSPTPQQDSSSRGISGHLKALASSLGAGVMNVAGSLGLGSAADKGGSDRARGAQRKAKASTKVGMKTRELEIDKNLLRDRYGRYMSSANKLEFGAASTLMFKSMCQHYANYAAKNRIVYDRKGCEQ